MFFKFSPLFCSVLTLVQVVVATDYATPPPTFQAKEFTTWQHLKHDNSKRADILIPFTGTDGLEDSIKLFRVDLVGESYDRGYGHGYLLSKGRDLIFLCFPFYKSYLLSTYFNEIKSQLYQRNH